MTNHGAHKMKARRRRGTAGAGTRAFTLLEVMIAVAIFAIGMFAILDLTSQGLRSARALQQPAIDFGSLAADLMLTNMITEGSESGDFGSAFPDYSWSREVYQRETNGLFQVDFVITERVTGWNRQARFLQRSNSILLYRPDSRVATSRLP